MWTAAMIWMNSLRAKKKDKTPLPPEEEKLFSGWDYNPILQKEKPEIPSPGDEEEQNSSSDSEGLDANNSTSGEKGKEKKASELGKEEKNVKPKAHQTPKKSGNTSQDEKASSKGTGPEQVGKRKSRREIEEGKRDEKRHDDKKKQIDQKINEDHSSTKGLKEHKQSKKQLESTKPNSGKQLANGAERGPHERRMSTTKQSESD